MADKINLDRTLDLTLKIMNGEVQVPENIDVSLMFGAMSKFNFKGSKVSLPIEHIGLAMLANKVAVSQFMVKRVNDLSAFASSSPKYLEGLMTKSPEIKDTVEQIFEPINHKWGVYVADFLNGFEPDALGWYTKPTGEKLSLKYFDNHVMRPNYNVYKKSATDEDMLPRISAVREGFNSALDVYLKKCVEFGKKSQNEQAILQDEEPFGEQVETSTLTEGDSIEDFEMIERVVFNERLQQMAFRAQNNYELTATPTSHTQKQDEMVKESRDFTEECKILEFKLPSNEATFEQ